MAEKQDKSSLLVSGLLSGSVTVATWGAIWTFGAAIGSLPSTTTMEVLATILLASAISSASTFLLAWLLVRFVGLEWSATVFFLVAFPMAILAFAGGGLLVLLALMLVLFPVLKSVDLLSRAWAFDDDRKGG